MSQSTLDPAATMTTYQVSGMTCSHCVHAVTAEVTEIKAVTDVTVDLTAGTVTVFADQPVDPARVAAAIREAGYELT